ncbi:MAG: DUF433 domain-containing protein [Candidatus Rokuibacteriota bacterium]
MRTVRLKEFDLHDIRALPNYTIAEASHYLRISASTIGSWVTGRDYPVQGGQRRFHPVIRPAQAEPMRLLSFINLVEAHVLQSIRHIHQVKLRKVRSALDYVERQFGGRHPLATQQFQTDGIDLFIEKLGELIIVSAGGQVALREAFEAHLKRLEHDASGIAARLFPFTRPSHVDQPKIIVIDPRVSFGRPIIVGSGVPTSAIVERYHAGESTEHLAKDYRRSPEEIEEAVRCETSRA